MTLAKESNDQRPLLERIGGERVVLKLVDKFYDRVLKDAELAPFFKHSSMDNLRRMQKEFFCSALDGPPTYEGLSVAKAHHGRGIKIKHFNLFAHHLLETLKEFKISEEDIDAVITRINLQANDVTGSPTTSD